MERKSVLSEQEDLYLDFSSTSTLLLRCSIDSKDTHTIFEWTDYSTAAFRNLQELDDIGMDDYMDSVRGHETLRFLFSHKKNVSPCHLSLDDRFILKIISKSQMKVFLEILPKYYHHVKEYKNTLLTKFYGLHVVKQQGGQKVRFIVTRNILRSDLLIHKHFILRGSSHSHSHYVNKDGDEEDLNMVFHLHTSLRKKFQMQLKHDCNFLEELSITSYAFLLGMHLCSAPFEAVVQGRHSPAHSAGSDDGSTSSDGPESEHGDADQDLTSDNDSTSSCPIIQGKLGVEMAARAVGSRRKESGLVSTQTTGKNQLNNVMLFFGIIDILQQSSILKHVEHVFKSLQTDCPSVSGLNTRAYSSNFQEYICKIFPESDSDAHIL